MFRKQNWLLASFLLLFAVACAAPTTTAPQGPPSNPTAVSNNNSATSAPTAAQPTAAPPTAAAATDLPAVAQTMLPTDAVWVVVDNQVIAATPDAPHITLGEAPQHLNPNGMQVARDGSYIAYTLGEDDGRVKFFTLDMRTGTQEMYSDATNVAILGPRFSTDAKQLAYGRVDYSGAQGMWELRVRNLGTQDSRVLQQFVITQPTDHLRALSPMAWVADGLLAEELLWSSDAPPHGIMQVNVENGEVKKLNDKDHLRAEISPDGKFAAELNGILPMGPDVDSKSSLSVLNLESGESQAIVTDEPIWISTMRWAQDGSHLLYTKQKGFEGGITELVVTTPDGKNQQTLAIGDAGLNGVLHDAVWQDANTILLLVRDAADALHLYKLSTDNLKPDAVQELATFAGGMLQGSTARILYVPS